MKIAIYSGEIPSTVFIEHLIRGLAERGHTVYVYGRMQKKYQPVKRSKGVWHSPLSCRCFLYGISWFFRFYFLKTTRVYSLMKQVSAKGWRRSFDRFLKLAPMAYFDVDVFHMQWAKTLQQMPELFDLVNARFVVSFRGAHINYSPLFDPSLKKAYEQLFPKVHAFHAVSATIAREAQKYGDVAERTRVICPAVSPQLMEVALPERNSVNAPINVLSVGRFHWKKAYTYALLAVRKLLNDGHDVQYSIIAQGEIPEEIRFMLHDLQLNEAVKIIPGMPHGEIIRSMQQADVFLLPSVEEGIANVVLESMAVGLPVVTTDCGGLAEVIQDKINGRIVPVRQPEALANAVLDVVKLPPSEKHKMMEAARETIRQQHLIPDQLAAMEALYQSATRA
jgi:colanic acid/amylovoran biosynthesis glycosyltransferase